MSAAKPAARSSATGAFRAKTPRGAVARAPAVGEFKVTLKPDAIKTLQTRKARVAALMEALSERIEESRRHGRSTRFVVEVDAKGQPRLRSSDDPTPQAPADDDLDSALEAARERGRLRAGQILAGAEMLSADGFADLLGVSRMTVHDKRRKHEVLALDGAKRGYRFPAWQVDENGKPFAAIRLLFGKLGDSPWTVYRFLVQRHPELDGATGVEALRRGRTTEVLETAEGIAGGTFA